jgi:integrase
MASISRDKSGCKRILFVAGDGSRKTIRLGKCNVKQAETFKLKLEALVSARRMRSSIDNETSQWVAGLPDDIYAKLAAAGLVTARAATLSVTLGPFLAEYTESRCDVKPNTQLVYGRTRKHLLTFFGPDKLLGEITPGDADAWRLYLCKCRGRQVGHDLAENTVRRMSGVARQFFRAAQRRRLVAENPFAELKVSVTGNPSREYFLSRQDAERVIEACPDGQWRLIFALARYGGLRTPSEILLLKWVDVDWDKSRMKIHSPKTEHHPGGESRLVPTFPELYPHLLAAYEEAEPGTEYVITRYRKSGLNLRTQLMRILDQAGLQPWPKLWQNLRATRQTELQQSWPEYVVCAWMGNSKVVAREHYLQVTDEHYERAAQNAAHLAHFAAQYPAALSGMERNVTIEDGPKNAVLPLIAASCGSVHEAGMGDTGLEPVTSCV